MPPRIAWLLPAALCLTACPKAPLLAKGGATAALSPEQAKLRAEVDRIAADVAALLEAQNARIWAAWTQGTPASIPQTYAGRDALLSVETIQKVDQLRQLTQDARELRALTALHSFLVGELLGRELGDLNDAVANLEASLTFSANGKEVRLRDLDRLLANEPNAARRKALWQGAVPALERLNQMLRRQLERTEQLLGELGYSTSEAYAAELRQADFDQLMAQAEEILDVTEAPYREVMGRLAQRELGVPFAKLTRADLPRLFRAQAVEQAFPKEKLVPRLEATLSGLGLSPRAVPQLNLDVEERPRKNPRPLALALRGTSDVRLSVVPATGVREQAAALRALGQALHLALTTEKRFELARLGGTAARMAYGLLFQDLVEDPVWLEEQAGLNGQARADYLSAAGAQRLFLLRRDAGKLLYQLRLRREMPDDPRELYREVLARTDLLPVTEADTARFLQEQDDLLQAADRLRAQLLAGQLQGEMKARFGPAWWHKKEAGALLRQLFAPGNGRTPREVAQALGAPGLVPDVLLLRLGATLGVPIRLNAAGTPAVEAPTPAQTPGAEAPASEAPETPAAAAPAPQGESVQEEAAPVGEAPSGQR